MLKPKYLARLPDTMVALYSEVEQAILADMARRLATYDYWIPAADWQYQKLIEGGNFHSFVLDSLAARTGKTRQDLERMMEEAGAKALRYDTDIYKRQGLDVPPLAESAALRNVLSAGLKATQSEFRNLARTTAKTATGQFEHALDAVWLKVQSGAFDVNTAVRDAVKVLSQAGVQAIRYPTGHTDSLEVAVRRAAVTGINQTCGTLSMTLADELGCDLVEVSAHAGARPEHAAWQGQIYSRSGKSDKYPDFVRATGYGTGPGLCGWNCRHSFSPYYEGGPRAYGEEQLRGYEAKDYAYNGQQMTEYEATQRQRQIERNIRRWKRENVAMGAAGLDTTESAAKIHQWQETQKAFIRQTGLKRQGSREQIAGWGRAEANAARSAAKKASEMAKPQLKNAAGQAILVVTRTSTRAAPNSITQRVGPKGGIDRSFYGSDGLQTLQISNHGHGHKKEEALGLHGEHAHDYFWDDSGAMTRGDAREITDQERRDNNDFL